MRVSSLLLKSSTFYGVGTYNYEFVLHDPYFLQAVQNTFILVGVTVPLSTLLALAISLGISSIPRLRELFQTIFFLPYVTNTLAVGLVFMYLFDATDVTPGLINVILGLFGMSPSTSSTAPTGQRCWSCACTRCGWCCPSRSSC